MIEDFRFRNGEDPLNVLRAIGRQAALFAPFILIVWSVVGFYNWSS